MECIVLAINLSRIPPSYAIRQCQGEKETHVTIDSIKELEKSKETAVLRRRSDPVAAKSTHARQHD